MKAIKERDIGRIGGLNSNIEHKGKIYHVQTEVLPTKKVVVTNVFDKGDIIYTDFASFKKFYEDISISDTRLVSGVRKLVALLHNRAFVWIRNKKESEVESLFLSWVRKTANNLKSDYGSHIRGVIFYDFLKRSFLSVSENLNLVWDNKVLESFMVYFNRFLKLISTGEVSFTTVDYEEQNLIMLGYKKDFAGIFMFEKTFPIELAKVELKRFLHVFNKCNETF